MKMLKLTRRGPGFSVSTFSCARKFIFSHMKMFGGGALLQNGEFQYIFYRRLITSLDFVKLFFLTLDYISRLLPQTGCPEKLCGPRYLRPKLATSAIFAFFSIFRRYFVNYSKNMHSRRKFLSEEIQISLRRVFFTLWFTSKTFLNRVSARSPQKIAKFYNISYYFLKH